MKKIYMVFLGGKCQPYRIEVHDVVFVVAEGIECACDFLLAQWGGEQKGVHMDAYRKVTMVDGFKVTLNKTERSEDHLGLYFVQTGGYSPGVFGENHEYGLLVSSSMDEARHRAINCYCSKYQMPHVDAAYKVDELTRIHEVDSFPIYVEKSNLNTQDEIITHYVLLSDKNQRGADSIDMTPKLS